MINDVDTTNFVDQLNQVELQIQKIKDRIKSIESMDKGKGKIGTWLYNPVRGYNF